MLDFVKNIAIGCDHAGFVLKELLIRIYSKEKFNFLDQGTFSADSVDYPDFAVPVCRQILENKAEVGVLICGSGNGMSITANKFPGIRATICWIEEIARMARMHNDANILVLPARYITEDQAEKIFKVFMTTPFEGGRHIQRLNKVDKVIR